MPKRNVLPVRVLAVVLPVVVLAGCRFGGGKPVVERDELAHSDRVSVEVAVSPEEAVPLGIQLKEGVERQLADAGATRTYDVFRYVLQVSFEVDTDYRDPRSPLGYLDADVRIVRTADGSVLAQKNCWERHGRGNAGGRTLMKESSQLGGKIARWCLRQLP
jgi:hypothetical protein